MDLPQVQSGRIESDRIALCLVATRRLQGERRKRAADIMEAPNIV